MDVWMIEPAMAAAALASRVVRYSHNWVFGVVRNVLPSQKSPGCFVAGAGDGDGDGYAISEVKICRL
jgi:hypothetical protein